MGLGPGGLMSGSALHPILGDPSPSPRGFIACSPIAPRAGLGRGRGLHPLAATGLEVGAQVASPRSPILRSEISIVPSPSLGRTVTRPNQPYRSEILNQEVPSGARVERVAVAGFARRILGRGYAVGKIPEPALVDRGSSRRFLVMRYPTRANQHDHRRFCPTRPSIPSCVGKKLMP